MGIIIVCVLAVWTLGLLTVWSMCVAAARADRQARRLRRSDAGTSWDG